ncbi:MAG: MoaD/ThiS family protein [Treponema sp.]|jgi:molybdopterin converting factor small subunit|nr:MoaD/ThiS family protein [Treponema sp.]
MRITIKYRAHLAAITKIAEEQIEASAVKDVLNHIKANFGADAEKKAKTMLITVNGENILLRKLFKTVLLDGDEVSFLPICGGG